MATRQPANVQAYLDKHKIASIFEELTSLLVKELPESPLDFIINKLQAKKKKGVGSGSSASLRSASSTTTGPKKKLDVTGTAIPSKSSSSQLTKPKTAGTSATTSRPASGSKTTTTTGRPKPTAPTTVSSSSSKISSPAATKKTTGAASKSTGSAGSGLTKPTTPKSKAGTTPSGLKKPGTPVGTKTPPTKPKASTATKKPVTKPAIEKKQQEVKPTEKVLSKDVIKEQIVQEEPKMKVEDIHDDDDDEVGSPFAMGEPGEEVSDSDSTGDEEDTQIDILELLQKRQRCKHNIKQNQEKQHLKLLLYNKDSSPVSGYHSNSDDDDDDDDEGLEVVESIDALEEEGVVLTGEARRMSMKLPTPSPSVDLKVRICARCAKVLGSEDTSTVSKLTSIDEFESASQINSQASFPQWDMETTEQGELSAKQKWAMGCVPSNTASELTNVATASELTTVATASELTTVATASELTSDSTVNTDDTWKGLSPQTLPVVPPPSDEESELKIPEPIDYQKPDDEDSITVSED